MLWDALKVNGRLEGQPTDPARFTHDVLIKREAFLGRSTFQLQFMLDTTLSDQERFPLKVSDLVLLPLSVEKGPLSVDWSIDARYVANEIYSPGFAGDVWRRPMFIDQERLPYTGSVMAIDPAGRGGDETAYAVVKLLNGRLFLTAAGGLSGGYDDENLKKLVAVAKYQAVRQVLVEANFGDGMFAQLLRPILSRAHPCGIEERHSTTQKERRIIDTLEPVMNQHRLIVNEEVAVSDYRANREHPSKQLFWQMTHITRERKSLVKDDHIDAVASGVAFWVEAMARDTDRAAEDARQDLIDEEIRRLEEAWGFGGRQNPSWIYPQ